MRLLYITNGINGSGGLERVLSIKASILADKLGYEVAIMVLNNAHQDTFYNFSSKIKMYSISVIGNPKTYIKNYIQGVKSVLDKFKPEVISVCDDGLKGFFFPILFKKKIPVIYERHASVNLNFNRGNSTLISKLKFKIQLVLMRWAAKKFDRFVVLTHGNLKEWKSNNLMVIPNPLSFYPKAIANRSVKRVIAVGSHSYNKGYDLLLDSWVKVIKTNPEWKLAVYGKKDEQNTYLNLSKSLNLEKSVDFFDPVNDIQAEYLNSSIMVLPSRSEGFGMVLIEAMACGVPCVSFDCPEGPADIIENGKDGFLVENGNVEKLASHILKLIEEENLRVAMGVKARENVKRFLPVVIVKQWDELFTDLIK